MSDEKLDGSAAQLIAALAMKSSEFKIVDLGDHMEVWNGAGDGLIGSYPKRPTIKHHFTTSSLMSWWSYVSKFGSPDTALVKHNDEKICAILDSGTSKPEGSLSYGAGDHTATFTPKLTTKYQAFLAGLNKWSTRQDTAEWLNRMNEFVVSIDSADLLSMVRDMGVSKSIEFREAVDHQTGAVKFVYDEAAETRPSGEIELPKSISFHLPVVDGLAPGTNEFSVEVDLRWRLVETQLDLRMDFPWIDDLTKEAKAQALNEAVLQVEAAGYTAYAI